MNKRLLITFLALFFVFFANVKFVFAQDSLGSADGPAATGSTTTSTSTTSGITTLPQTGANDILILFLAGIIFLIAGITALSGTRQVFNDIE